MTTFSRIRQTNDPATDTWSSKVETTIAGAAIQVRGDPQRYKALELIESAAPTLFFTPTDYELQAFTDEFVKPGDTCTWNGLTFTARDVTTIAPDGIVIAARIVVSQ